ncbi:beta-lactamase family protein [Algoriphagus aestuarii]|nr:beta-lactamase family protein [Algoriphagus aestuarii]
MFRSQFIPLVFAAFLLSPTAFSQTILQENSTISVERLSRYDQFIDQNIQNGMIPGAVVMILKNGEVVHQKAFGRSDIANNEPMVKDQIFYIQSMTKPIVTVAFMMLYEEGHFQLNDPVEKYLPWFKEYKISLDPSKGIAGGTKPAQKKITIANLLSHTAGFSHGIAAGKLEEEIRTAMYASPQENIESRVRTLISQPMIGEPGEQWYYSASPDVLSLLIEKFSGMSSAAFLQQRLFDPLEMKDTGYNLTEDQKSRMVQVHTKDENGKLMLVDRQTPTEGNKVFGGTHGLFSTAEDYSKFTQMLLNGGESHGIQFLSPKTIEIMTIDQTNGLYRDPGHGFGFGFAVLEDLADAKSLGSEGQYFWSGAYCTFFFVDPKENLISIFMTQMATYDNYWGEKMRQFVYQAIE